MTDKVQKIKQWISREQDCLMDTQGNFENPSDEGAFHILSNLDYYIDSLQEEPCNSCQGFNDKDKCDELVFTHNCPIVKNPVSIWHDASEMPDKEKKILTIGYNDETYVSYFNGVNPRLIKQWAYIDVLLNLTTKEEPVSEDLEAEIERINKNNHFDFSDWKAIARHFANWQKEKDSVSSKDLEELIDTLSKRYPEVSFAKLSRIAVRVSNWQKKQDQETIELAEDHAMLAGIVKGKEEAITKACKYLQEHREEVETEDNGIAGWISNEFIEDFENYMKG